MKYALLLAVLSFVLLGPERREETPPQIFTEKSSPGLYQLNGVWMFNDREYNGYVVEKKGGKTLAILPVLRGLEHGMAFGWYENGQRQYERRYLGGKREGQHRGWYPNGALAFVQVFHNDMFHGPQKTYFENGQPWQLLQYVYGYEEGKQKTWNQDGRLINNFTVRKGKLYGVIGRYDCMSVVSK